MGLGWGVLKQMSDTFKYNRSLLGKKKSVRQIYKDEIKKRGTTLQNVNVTELRSRIAKKLKRNRTQEILTRLIAGTLLLAFFLVIVWAIVSFDFTWKKEGKYDNKSALFTTILYKQPNGLILKKDFYKRGPKAAVTFLKDGLKHQNAESFYESGEQFRSALYFYDTLVKDLYFFKSGDTIKHFPTFNDTVVYRVSLVDSTRQLKVEFDFFDGKIIQDTYKELKLIE